MAKKGNRVQVILECTEQKESGVAGMSRYITTKNKKNTPGKAFDLLPLREQGGERFGLTQRQVRYKTSWTPTEPDLSAKRKRTLFPPPSDRTTVIGFPACTSGRFIARRNKTVPETGGWEKTMKIDLGQVQARDAEILEAAEESCTVLLGAGGGGITLPQVKGTKERYLVCLLYTSQDLLTSTINKCF